MKINKLKLFSLALIICSFTCFPSLAGGDTSTGELSGAIASAAVGGGALSTIAAPVLIPVGIVALSGGDTGVLGAGLSGPLVMSAGIVGLVGAAGVGLSDLTDDSINSVNYQNVPANTPKAVIDVKGQKEEIPFVVRPNFVQMNEEVKQ
jgi:hypothetical protein